MIVLYSRKSEGRRFVSPHFRVDEFASHDGCDKIAIDRGLCELLEDLHDRSGGRRVRILSGYRTEGYNRRVHGARASLHMLGRAADIVIDGMTPRQVAALAEQLFAESEIGGGIGLYEGRYCHVDIRALRARWLVTQRRERAKAPGFY